MLHQINRPRDPQGRIIASLDDYEVVRDLVAGVVSEGVGATVSVTVRDTVAAVAALAGLHPDGVTATALAEKMGLDKSAARRRLLMARRDSYLENREDRRGHPGRWVVGEPLPEEVELLPPRHRLADKTAGQPSGGTVAGESKRERLEVGKLYSLTYRHPNTDRIEQIGGTVKSLHAGTVRLQEPDGRNRHLDPSRIENLQEGVSNKEGRRTMA